MFNNFTLPDFYPALDVVFMLGMACLLLLLSIWAKHFHRNLVPALAVAVLAGCFVITWITADPQVVLTFSNMYVDDPLADFLKLMVYVAVAASIIYGRTYLIQRDIDRAEYYVLMLFATLGMMVMISSAHMLSIYLGLEMLSLSLYAMVAIDRDSAKSSEAAMKYFVLGAIASAMLLYGMSMVYGATGQLEIGGVAQALRHGDINLPVLVLGLVFVVAGLGFKLGSVPFHMWLPDVYQGAPTPVTVFIGSAPKIAAFAMIMRLLVYGMFDLARQWQIMFLILALLSIAVGNLAAIAQKNLKRMLAYSTISHMGFMLLAFTSGVFGTHRQFDFVLNAYSSAMYYTIAYVLMALAGFGMILLLSRNGFEADNIDDFKGLNKRSPWFAAMMMFVMFSQAGIPFFIGFFAKFSVLLAVIVSGYIWVAVFAVGFSLVGAFYYLRIVKLMYFDAPEDMTPLVAPLDMRILLSVNALAIAALGIYPAPLMEQCTEVLLRSL